MITSLLHLALMLIGGTPLVRCEFAVNPFVPTARDSYFWAVFDDEVYFAGDYYVQSDRFAAAVDGRFRSPTWGQLVHIGALEAAGQRSSFRADDHAATLRAIVVPWGNDAGCATIPISTREPWGTPGDTAFFRAVPRPRNLWVGGLPTFDVYFDYRTVYPFIATNPGKRLAQQYPGTTGLEKLRAVAAFDLVRTLPHPCEYFTESAEAIRRFKVVADIQLSGANDPLVEDLLQTHERLSRSDSSYWRK